MKKAICFALALCSCLLVGCNKDDAEDAKQVETVVLAKSACYEISMLNDDDGTKYSYTVLTQDGETLESALCAKKPEVKPLNDDLIGIRFYTSSSTFCRYYDVKNGRVSDSYFGAFWDNGTLLAYNDYESSSKLVVRDIFDADGYYAEYEIDSDAMELIVKSAEENEDSTELCVTYTLGESGWEQTARIPLVENEE